jgi:transcriptional regulator with XRE-family HTH domain
MEFKDRLKQARTKKGLSQGELAKVIQVHVTNISRYERGENKPTSEVLSKLAGALDTTVDFLMSGSLHEQADTEINDKELLSQFKQVEQLNPEDKRLVKTFIDAFLTKRQLQQLAH